MNTLLAKNGRSCLFTFAKIPCYRKLGLLPAANPAPDGYRPFVKKESFSFTWVKCFVEKNQISSQSQAGLFSSLLAFSLCPLPGNPNVGRRRSVALPASTGANQTYPRTKKSVMLSGNKFFVICCAACSGLRPESSSWYARRMVTSGASPGDRPNCWLGSGTGFT